MSKPLENMDEKSRLDSKVVPIRQTSQVSTRLLVSSAVVPSVSERNESHFHSQHPDQSHGQPPSQSQLQMQSQSQPQSHSQPQLQPQSQSQLKSQTQAQSQAPPQFQTLLQGQAQAHPSHTTASSSTLGQSEPLALLQPSASQASSSIVVPPTTIVNPIISSNTTPINSGLNTPNSESIFKIPKKVIVSNPVSIHHIEGASASANALSAASSASSGAGAGAGAGAIAVSSSSSSANIPSTVSSTSSSPSVAEKLNNTVINNLNISLKAKQSLINSNEAYPKNSSIIEEILNTATLSSAFTSEKAKSGDDSDVSTILNVKPGLNPALSDAITSDPNPEPIAISSTLNSISAKETIEDDTQSIKRATVEKKKQNAQITTRTDFFAAKLASAVDDVDSSDSDETFVYENNVANYDSNNNNNMNTPGPQQLISVIDSPRTEEMSNHGSIMNAPGVLSSPPVMGLHIDDHNNTINSIGTLPTDFAEGEIISSDLNDGGDIEDKCDPESSQAASTIGVSTATSPIVATSSVNGINSIMGSPAPAPHMTSTQPATSTHTVGAAPAAVAPTTQPPNLANTATNNNANIQLQLQYPLSDTFMSPAIGTSTPLNNVKTDSIQSLRSIKFPKTNTSSASKAPLNNNESNSKDVTTISGKERPQTQRSNSIYSMTHPTLKGMHNLEQHQFQEYQDQPVFLQNSPNESSIGGAIANVSNVSGGYFDNRSSYQPSRAGTSINDTFTNEDRYSSEEIDEDAEVIDDGSTAGEFYVANNDADATINGHIELQSQASHHQHPHEQQQQSSNGSVIGSLVGPTVSNSGSIGLVADLNPNPTITSTFSNYGGPTGTNSVTSKSTKNNNKKSSTTSSKLRSTTSKLFDKRGSQPRRYSIIPDDIDIEDFDDELIYYDNNIRFPYSSIGTNQGNNLILNNNSNGNNNNNGNNNEYNENSPLIGEVNVGGIPGRIPHYRSLNLNSTIGKKHTQSKNRRYLSGRGFFGAAAHSDAQPSEDEGKITYPFQYGDPTHQHNQPFYYNFAEYGDELQSDGVDNNQVYGRKLSRTLPGGYSSGGGHPHLSASNGHFFLPRKRSSSAMRNTRINCIKSFIYTLVSILTILSIGFIMGFVLATTKELTHVSILSIENTLVSEDELVFNIVVEAFNPGWFSVDIQDVELDIFAKSGYLPEPNDGNGEIALNAVETVLLGSILTLELPMSFRGGFFNREAIKQVSEVKLVLPGKNLTVLSSSHIEDEKKPKTPKKTPVPVPEPKPDPQPELPDNSKKWEIISKNPFDLIIRGLLKYKLPLNKNQKSAVVKVTSFVDPKS